MTALPQFRFRLYLAGTTENSQLARANLTALCREHFAGQYTIEVINVLVDPLRAQRDGAFITPMLVKHDPTPVVRIIGTLNDPELLLRSLGREPVVL